MSGLSVIDRAQARGFRPQPRVSTSAWCGRELWLTDESGGRRDRFNLVDRPYLVGILDCLDDPLVETIAWVKAAQVGGTTTLISIILSRRALDPAPMMFAGPDREYVREKSKLTYMCAEKSPALADFVPPENRRNSRLIHLGNCVCYLAWSGSTQSLSGRACRLVLCSEVDRWRDSVKLGRSAELVKERVKSFPVNHKIFYESTPSDEASTIEHLYVEGDQRTWQLACPHCGHWQALRVVPHREGKFAGGGGIGGMQNELGEWRTPEEARRHAFYVCERGCTITHGQKHDFCRRGLWVPAGQRLDKQGRLTGKPDRSCRHVSFRSQSLDTASISWGWAAEEYLIARKNSALREYWNNWLGRAWKSARGAPKWKQVGTRLAQPHERGLVPTAALFLTAGLDVMPDFSRWVVRAWGEGSTSWLVDWGTVKLRPNEAGDMIPNSDLAQLEDLLFTRNFKLVAPNRVGAEALRVRMAGVDTGHRIWDVWQWGRAQIAKHGDRLRFVAGDTRAHVGQFFKLGVVEKSARTGKVYEGGMRRWMINVDTYKDDIHRRLTAPLGEQGNYFFCADVCGCGEEYLRELCNEAKIETLDKKGRQVVEWRVVDKHTGNHYFDCEVYDRAIADMITGQDWGEVWRRCMPPARQVAPPEENRFTTPSGQPFLITERS